MWGPDQLRALTEAVERFDQTAAKKLIDAFSAEALANRVSDDDQKKAFDQLRRARFFALMRALGEVLGRAGVATRRTRRQHAQALIELKAFGEALTLLEALVQDPECPTGELAEGRGLIGRVHKQTYVDQLGKLGPARRDVLGASVRAYYEAYCSDKAGCTWQGINAVAMLLRGRRDGIHLPSEEDPCDMAKAILVALAQAHDHWDLATRAEAHIARGDWDEARTQIAGYVHHPGLDSFSCASTERQLREVWQLSDSGEGSDLLAILKGAVLRGSVDSSKAAPERMRAPLALERAVGITKSGRSALEKTFGSASSRPYVWVESGLSRAKAVARIDSASGVPYGTGFLVRASALLPGGSEAEALLVTNSHVLGNQYARSLRASAAVVRFEAADLERTFRVQEIVFESSPGELDVTVARLDSAVVGVTPCPLGSREEPVFESQRTRNCYVIGHPKGEPLALSFEDSLQVGWATPRIHYRTPTEPGSSGSPVFDEHWEVLALHHAGANDMDRLDGQLGTYEANEGIWIHAIVDAIAKAYAAKPLSARAGLEALPAVRPTFRRGVLIGCASADDPWRARLAKHLRPLTGDDAVTGWDERCVQPGSGWFVELEGKLATASVLVLLVSEHFVRSDGIVASEFPRLLDAARARGLTVVPVLVSPCDYVWWRSLKQLELANVEASPLEELPEQEFETTLATIADSVARALTSTQLSNGLRAMDALAFPGTGFGGEASVEAGLSGLGARVERVGRDIVVEGPRVPKRVISWSRIGELAEDSRKLIRVQDGMICELFDRWLEDLPQRTAPDHAVRESAIKRLARTRTDLCTELNGLLTFFHDIGCELEDHYKPVRHICR